MSRREIWFCRVVAVGIAINLIVAIPILIAPAWALALLSAPQPEPIIYARLVGLLVILLGIFYLPAALDPDRYRVVSWIAELARLTAALFFVAAARALDERTLYLPALLDFSFFLIQGVLLIGIRGGASDPWSTLNDRAVGSTSKSTTEGAPHEPS